MADQFDANAVILTKEFMRQLKEIENWRNQQNVILRKINNVHAKLTSIKGEKMVKIAEKAYQKLDNLYKQLKHLAEQEATACRDSLLIIGTDLPDCMNPDYHTQLVAEKKIEEKEKKKQEKRQRLMQQQGLMPQQMLQLQQQQQAHAQLQQLQAQQQAAHAQAQQLLQQQLLQQQMQQQYQNFRGAADPFLGLGQQHAVATAQLAAANLSQPMASPPAPAHNAAASSAAAAAAASAAANAAADVSILMPGTEVAAKIRDKRNPQTPEQWILARVVRYLAERDRYEVEDVDPGDEGEPQKKHVVPSKQIMPLPNDDDFDRIPELPKDSHVIALFPDTTTFYEAIVQAPPKRQRKPGAVPEYQVIFNDDEEDGVVPKRKVPFKHVLPRDGGFFWMHAIQMQH
eukprot:tig00020704_g13164.t1